MITLLVIVVVVWTIIRIVQFGYLWRVANATGAPGIADVATLD